MWISFLFRFYLSYLHQILIYRKLNSGIVHLDLIKNQTDKNIIIFYQDPWPEPVPSFIEMDTTVIRFGFDEGCELDKKCIDPNFSIAMEDGEYNFLVNKNNSINLNNKKSII